MTPSFVLNPSSSSTLIFAQPALRSPVASVLSTRAVAGTQQDSAFSNDSGSNMWLGAATAIAGSSAVGAASRRRNNRTLRRAEKPTAATKKAPAEEAPAKKKKQEPPPPPAFDPAKQPGVTLPLMFFDPLGFCKKGDEENFRKYRSAELKHGRVAMLAALGAIGQHWLRFPGFDGVPSGVKAVTTVPGIAGLVALFLGAGFVETQLWVEDPDKEPGNFGDPAGMGQYYIEWRHRELNNGRFAMFAILGIIVAELYTGKDGFDQIWATNVGELKVE